MLAIFFFLLLCLPFFQEDQIKQLHSKKNQYIASQFTYYQRNWQGMICKIAELM